jgi:4,5-DOPA dioxygenase extradiol
MVATAAVALSYGAAAVIRAAGIEAARRLPRPKAIRCVAAHWETRGAPAVSASPAPETSHDFGGFPQALFDVR